MKLLFISPTDGAAAWTQALAALMPELEVRVWPEVGNAEDIDVALAWKPPAGQLRRLPRLRLILSLGMGVDYILADPELPADVPIVRMVDDDLIAQMSEYVSLAVLRHHRRVDDYERLQRERRWQQFPPPDTATCTVGILGLGAIGSHTARTLATLGFPLVGWSRGPKQLDGIETFHGQEGLARCLSRSRILVCLLPLTPQTEGILNAKTLAQLPSGAYLINCARGDHVVEKDLLAALDSGHLAGAALDVFRQEPLPQEHPFWDHPKVRVTPHIAGLTKPRTAAAQVVENIRRLAAGEPLLNAVDRSKGY